MSKESITLPAPAPRDLYFYKQVDQESIEKLTKEILEVNESDVIAKESYKIHGIDYHPQPIKIYINSYGGSCYDYLGLWGIMETSVVPIHTYVVGYAMSAAFSIAVMGHKRFCYKYATFMYHQSWDILAGPIKEIKDNVKEMERLELVDKEVILRRTKISEERLIEVYEKKIDWYLNATQAEKLGIVDEVI